MRSVSRVVRFRRVLRLEMKARYLFINEVCLAAGVMARIIVLKRGWGLRRAHSAGVCATVAKTRQKANHYILADSFSLNAPDRVKTYKVTYTIC